MPSSYTTLLRAELPATGELAGLWGTQMDSNMSAVFEPAIAGTANIVIGAGDYTLSVFNNADDEARKAILNLSGNGGHNVIAPAASKLYTVINGTSGVTTIKTAAGAGVAIPQSGIMHVYVTASGVYAASASTVSPTFTGTVTATAFAGSGASLTGAPALVGTNFTGTAAGLTAGSATTAATVTTNANLTGNVTSVGNATTIASLPAISGAALTNLTGAQVTGTVANATNATNAGSATNATNWVGGSWNTGAFDGLGTTSGTAHSNGTGKDIMVSVGYDQNSGVTIVVGGVTILLRGSSNVQTGFSFMVGNGASYTVTAASGISSWAEFR